MCPAVRQQIPIRTGESGAKRKRQLLTVPNVEEGSFLAFSILETVDCSITFDVYQRPM